MITQLFLGLALLGADWVLFLLIGLSVLSVAIVFERFRFYTEAERGLQEFRTRIRDAVFADRLPDALKMTQERLRVQGAGAQDLETPLTLGLLEHVGLSTGVSKAADVLDEVAQDSLLRARPQWERFLVILGTIGNNAPFVGLFGTVLGIIKAFNDLSVQQAGGGTGAPQTVMVGVSEALVATAVGILVAIPAVVAFNLFQRRVKSALAQAEALKSYLIGKLAKGD